MCEPGESLALRARPCLVARPFRVATRRLSDSWSALGTKASTVYDILASGTNKNFSGGIFGHGTYFAEDAGKNNQYVQDDPGKNDSKYCGKDRSSPLQPLHIRLYGKSTPHPKGSEDCFADDSFGPEYDNVYYLILCRVIIGMPVFTKDGNSNIDGSGSVWAKKDMRLSSFVIFHERLSVAEIL